jgi:hypothetical protein
MDQHLHGVIDMRLTCCPYPGDLGWTAASITRALAALGEPVGASTRITLHGPFPLYIADPKQYARGATRRATTQSGWRALVSDGKHPLASINLSCPEREKPSIHVRGKAAARPLYKALEKGLDWLKENDVPAELRFISFPSLFITAVWLHGRTPRFIPTRVEIKRQRDPALLTRAELIHIVSRTQRERTRRPRRVSVRMTEE